jgi:hypothetical protein
VLKAPRNWTYLQRCIPSCQPAVVLCLSRCNDYQDFKSKSVSNRGSRKPWTFDRKAEINIIAYGPLEGELKSRLPCFFYIPRSQIATESRVWPAPLIQILYTGIPGTLPIKFSPVEGINFLSLYHSWAVSARLSTSPKSNSVSLSSSKTPVA